MNYPITVVIDNGHSKTFIYKDDIKKMGFKYDANCQNWQKEINTEEELNDVELYCGKRGLAVISPFTKRSNNYRDIFFENTPPVDKRERYRCVYCGRKLKRNKVSVDHLISVYRSQISQKSRNKLRKMNCTSVNDVKNLVPSCRHCNSSKGYWLYPWIWMAKIGKNEKFWKIKNIIFYGAIIYTFIWSIFVSIRY
mgnify:CR=1 FL=1